MILGSTRTSKRPLRAIHVDDALNVGLDLRARQGPARLRLDFGGKLLVLDALVALELDAVDDRRLDDRHDDATALVDDLDVLKQAGGDQRFIGAVDLDRIEPLAGRELEIVPDRRRFDAPIPSHFDRLRSGGLRRQDRARGHAKRHRAQQQSGHAKLKKRPHHKFHA